MSKLNASASCRALKYYLQECFVKQCFKERGGERWGVKSLFLRDVDYCSFEH